MQNTPSMSAQAIGGAVGHNEVSIIILCHRVVGTNGSLTGYAGGWIRKLLCWSWSIRIRKLLCWSWSIRIRKASLLRRKEPHFKKFL